VREHPLSPSCEEGEKRSFPTYEDGEIVFATLFERGKTNLISPLMKRG